MPVTTVFEIGPGKFTVILYPTPTNVSSPSTSTQATHSTTTTYGTTRTATRSMDKNIHQVSTSIPINGDDLNNDNNNDSYTAAYPALGSTWSSAPSSSPSTAGVGETTILDGTTYTLGVEPFTYTSNGGVYTSVRVQRVPVQTGSEREVQEKNKSILTPIITAVVLTIVLGFLASLGGCWFYRRRRRRHRSHAVGAHGMGLDGTPGTPSGEKGTTARSRSRARSNAEKERGRLSRLDTSAIHAGMTTSSDSLNSRGGSGNGSGRGLLSASTTTGPSGSSTSTSSSTLPGRFVMPTRRLSVDEEDEPRIETMSIEEGTVTPFTLPAMMAAAAAGVDAHTNNNNNINTARLTLDDARPRRESFSTLSTAESDVFAMDGDSIARTLTGSSRGDGAPPPAYEAIEGGTYDLGSGLVYLGPAHTYTHSQSSHSHTYIHSGSSSNDDPFADPGARNRSQPRQTPLERQDTRSSMAESTSSSIPSSLLQPAMSEGGRSERSNPQTEASFRRGDDRDLHLGERWTARPTGPARTAGSFQGWSDSEVEDSDDEGTIMAGSDRIIGDDESWVNGSEFGRRTRQREQQQQQQQQQQAEDDHDDDDVFGDAHRAT